MPVEATLSLRPAALAAWQMADLEAKLQAVRALQPEAALDPSTPLQARSARPGRPARPELIPPTAVPRRSVAHVAGRAALIHALAHIEFTAVNLALDIVWRFAGLPAAFYRAWATVAQEEALHFSMLQAHLQGLGYQYGDFSAHDGLWDLAERTQDDVLARLALVPRIMEARGLDVTPGVRDRLAQAGDPAGAHILQRILEDEVGHVALGNHWYHHECAARGLDPRQHFWELLAHYQGPRPRGPFNVEFRLKAGFSAEELADLQAGGGAAEGGA